jgi:hypothetical protein
MRMPEMDGLDATRAVRALGGPWATLPIIAPTVNAFPDDMKAAGAAGGLAHGARSRGAHTGRAALPTQALSLVRFLPAPAIDWPSDESGASREQTSLAPPRSASRDARGAIRKCGASESSRKGCRSRKAGTGRCGSIEARSRRTEGQEGKSQSERQNGEDGKIQEETNQVTLGRVSHEPAPASSAGPKLGDR